MKRLTLAAVGWLALLACSTAPTSQPIDAGPEDGGPIDAGAGDAPVDAGQVDAAAPLAFSSCSLLTDPSMAPTDPVPWGLEGIAGPHTVGGITSAKAECAKSGDGGVPYAYVFRRRR